MSQRNQPGRTSVVKGIVRVAHTGVESKNEHRASSGLTVSHRVVLDHSNLNASRMFGVSDKLGKKFLGKPRLDGDAGFWPNEVEDLKIT